MSSVRGHWHSFFSEKSVLGTSLSTKMVGFPIFYQKFIYLSFLYDYGSAVCRYFFSSLCTFSLALTPVLKSENPGVMNG